MEFNLKTDKEELESIMTALRMMMDKGFNNDLNKSEMINQIMQVMMPLLSKSQQPQQQSPTFNTLPTDDQLRMLTNGEADFRNAIDARDALKSMIHPLYHM